MASAIGIEGHSSAREPSPATGVKLERKGLGLLAMVHPVTGDMFVAHPGDGAIARQMILDGYEPVGPRGKAAAAEIRAKASAQ